MASPLVHALLGGVLGIIAALLGCVVAPRMFNEPIEWSVTLLSIGAASGVLTGLVVSLLWQRSARAARRDASREAQQAAARESMQKEQQNRHARQLQRALKRWPSPFQHQLRARISPQHAWLTLSKSLAAVLRRSRNELRGQPVFQVFHPEDLPLLEAAFAKARSTRKSHSIALRLLKLPKQAPDEAIKPIVLVDTRIPTPPLLAPALFVHVRLDLWARRGPDGEVVEFWCLLHDRSAQMRAERSLRKEAREREALVNRLSELSRNLERLKESYRDLYHNAPVMFFSLDVDGKLVAFNDTLNRSLGRTRDELLRRPYTSLLASQSSAGAASQPIPLREGELETQWRRRDGTVIDIWIRTVAVVDENGVPTRFRSAALDLTEKNRLSHELRTRGDELERTNQRLMQINAELEDYTHVVSHDLKQPLLTLQNYSNMLAEEYAAQLGADGFQYVNHLVRASRRLGTLIDELLNLGHAGRIALAPEIFDLNRAVATVRQDLVDLIQRKEATILSEGALPSVLGDPHRIIQLLSNLIANGLKYNQHPTPLVVIGVAEADDPKQLVVYVRDNGIGIDPQHHDKIFGIFRRLHEADEYEGTGAGLAICKKIVEAHRGRIWVESSPGHGATFFFTLPRAPGNQVSIPPLRKESSAPTGNGAERPAAVRSLEETPPTPVRDRSGRPRIVLVEDTFEIGQVIQKLGKRAGQQIDWFTTAEKAWSYLQANRPDLLLCDINLPGMDGIELCRRLRRLPLHRDTLIAMFSREPTPEQLKRLKSAGIDHFVDKDLLARPRQWQARLEELLSSQPTMDQQ